MSSFHSTPLPSSFVLHPEVEASLASRKPVVALESTVIAHGLPYPDNVETALEMEAALREGGATPATIAIIQGEVRIGLTPEQLDYLGTKASNVAGLQAGLELRKCSRRDLSIVISQGSDGATTVAGTMILAHIAGIRLFVTGGIGGVHRGHPFDISADLRELGQTSVVVVCSGAKSILDLAATREILETNGVPVVGYGTDELPAFFSRSSGLAVDVRLDTPAAVASLIRAHYALNLQSGILLAVPVPEADAIAFDEAEVIIDRATREANAMGMRGPVATPWLLKRVAALTNGRSRKANVSLLRNNARIAGQIAMALAD